MRRQDDGKLLAAGIAAALREGGVFVPGLLLRAYPQLKLTDSETMLLIHLIALVEKENKEFPTFEEIQARMTAPPDTVIRMLQKLLAEGWISIDTVVDPSGVQGERYNLEGLFDRLAAFLVEERAEAQRGEGAKEGEAENLYAAFEREFGRPLTPMELETITGWLDQDRYGEALISAALKEAVFAGKLHFRYIDRILLEWSRQRIVTPEQATQAAQKYRGSRQ